VEAFESALDGPPAGPDGLSPANRIKQTPRERRRWRRCQRRGRLRRLRRSRRSLRARERLASRSGPAASQVPTGDPTRRPAAPRSRGALRLDGIEPRTMTTIYDTDGAEAGDVNLPEVFETPHRPDLIGRAVRTAQANRAQPYGADDYAGMRTPAESFGSGRGMAHVPRSNGQGRRVPQTVGGRPAHPPKEENDRSLKLNDNERKLATRSAIAATADAEL